MNRTTLIAAATAMLAISFCGCESSEDASGSYWQAESASGKADNNKEAVAAQQATVQQAQPKQSSSTQATTKQAESPKATTPATSTETKTAEKEEAPKADSETEATAGGETPAPAPAGAGDAVSFGSLKWAYGGVNGAGAAKTSASIGGLRMSAGSLSYSWTGPTLASWGLGDNQIGAYACLFVQKSDGSWVGGKFDWISTSRRSRGFENIYGGYSGWSLAGVPNPCQAAFVIISADCKKRTNVISGSWSR